MENNNNTEENFKNEDIIDSKSTPFLDRKIDEEKKSVTAYSTEKVKKDLKVFDKDNK